MKVIFGRNNLPFSWLIRAFTWSRWSHCGILDGNYSPEIIGFSATYPNGYLLNGCKKKVIDKFVTVTSC